MKPGDPEWERTMTASKVAAAIGVSPWQSPRALWHEMRGDVERPASNDQQRRGHYLEDGVLAWWRDQHNTPDHWWERHPTFHLGDWAAATPDAQAIPAPGAEPCLVEAKTTAYDDDWGEPGTDAVPTYYYAQALFQMHVSGVRTCYMPVLTSRLRFAEYVIDYDPEQGAALEQMARTFYDSLGNDEPPELDDTTATYEVLKRLHPDVDKDGIAVCDRDEAARFIAATTGLKDAEAADRAERSWALDRMGRARYLVCDGVKVARRQPSGKGIALYPLPQNLPLLDLGETA